MEDKFITRIITLFFIGVLFLLAYLIIKPILISIILGLLLAYVFHPVYKRIYKYVRQPDLATITLLIIIVFVIAIPVWILLPMVVTQTFETFVALQGMDIVTPLQQIFPSLIDGESASTITIHFNNFVGQVFSSFLEDLTDFLVNIPNLLLQFVVVLFTFYFAVRDSEKLKEFAAKLSPFPPSTEKKFLKESRNITNAIIYGQVLIGILQGLALGVGLFVLGVPKALILTVFTMIISIIPVLGPVIIWVPVVIYLFAIGNVFAAVFLLIYGALFVSSIDNVLQPIILAKNSNLPIVMGILGTMGGLYYFGIIGLILGPLILAYIMILFEFYNQGKLNELFKK